MISVISLSLSSILTKVLAATLSESMLKWTLFKVAEAIVKSTKTPLDDEWLEKLKKEYKE